jgi:hypothetical protein
MVLGLGFQDSEILCAHAGAMKNTDKKMVNTAKPGLAGTALTIIYRISFLITI